MTTDNQRPGVYSRYDISSVYAAPRSAGCAAVVAKARTSLPEEGGKRGPVVEITRLAELAAGFLVDSDAHSLYGCVQILLRSGVGKVFAVPVEGDDYASALARIEQEENIAAVVCDCADGEALEALRASVERSAQSLRERVGYCGLADAGEAAAAAQRLNSERVVLCCPAVCLEGPDMPKAVYGAAALAGMVLSKNDCAYSFNGETLAAVHSPARLAEEDIQALIRAGVTVLEPRGGGAECIRAVTTRTFAGGETDYSLRGLNAILCIDNVMQALRATLRGTRVSGRTAQSIQSQAAVVLSERRDAGVIESFETPRCAADPADPAVCVVELAFRIAHVISQIHVTAHIQV